MKVQNREKILITGCAGFIGMHLSKKLLRQNYDILGIDNLNEYYSVGLKNDRLSLLNSYENFKFIKVDIADKESLNAVFKNNQIDKVVNLAAQAGVRYSIINPNAYIESNILGFMNILECCRSYGIKGLIYASSSSVYGAKSKIPFSEVSNLNNPASIYAASKISNELMAKTYNNLYGLKSTGLRFFTVYGPWGRPDMAYYLFTEKILKNKTIKIFNYGKMERDYTYIDDIVNGIEIAIKKNYKYEIFNLGNNRTESLLDMLHIIEGLIGKKAKIKLQPMQLGDVKKTFANINKARDLLSYAPNTLLKDGLQKFLKWYLNNH